MERKRSRGSSSSSCILGTPLSSAPHTGAEASASPAASRAASAREKDEGYQYSPPPRSQSQRHHQHHHRNLKLSHRNHRCLTMRPRRPRSRRVMRRLKSGRTSCRRSSRSAAVLVPAVPAELSITVLAAEGEDVSSSGRRPAP